ncbi:MAG: transposase [Nonlabens sp.]|uniref:transposase n=1 Tax=Nonlabens sp. TaxID=1888209 RepID=UPI003EF442F4
MKQHNRKSIRLKGYDYTQVGRYFVTIVTRGRLHLFGNIVDGKMKLNAFGKIAANELAHTLKLRDNVSLGAFMIMPDHVHFVIHIDQQPVQKEYTAEEFERRAGAVAGKHINKPGSLGAIVRGYKGAVTRQVLDKINEKSDPPDNQLAEIHKVLKNAKTIWVRNYNDAIIKSQRHYDNVTKYINDNPKKWDEQLKAKLKLE